MADAARGMTRLSDVRAVVAEAIQHGRCDLASLITELNEGPAAGSRFYRVALAEISEGIRSAAEADMKHLIDKSDLEKPIYNAELYALDGTFLGIADAWWQRAGVVAEVDLRQYHLGPDDYERTVMRHNRMEAHSINLLALPAEHPETESSSGRSRSPRRHRKRDQPAAPSDRGYPRPRLALPRSCRLRNRHQ